MPSHFSRVHWWYNRSMKPWREIIQALRLVGPANAWRARVYRRRKEALDAAAARKTTLQGVGALYTVAPTESGARLTFALAAAEIVFLAPEVVRITWEPGKPPPPYAVPAAPPWERPEVVFRQQGETWYLRSSTLEVVISAEGLAFQTPLGELLRREAWPSRRGEGWRQSAWLHPQAAVFGLGERAVGPNLRPGAYHLWNRDPGGHYTRGDDPLYITMPVAWVLQPAGAYLVFHNNPAAGEIRLDDGFHVRFVRGALQTYLIFGEPEHIARRWAELTGFPALPPRWALGYHQSRWGYRTQKQVEAVLDGFHEHQMPLAALHLDIDYMDGYRLFTVNRRRFPDMEGMIARAHTRGVHVVAIVDAGVKRDAGYSVYRTGRERKAFCRLPNGEEVSAPVWPGWCAFPDFTDPEARTWWGEQMEALLTWRLDGLWLDMNEPAAFVDEGDPTLPLVTRHVLEGEGGDHVEAHNLYALQMARATHEALRARQPDRRPWLLSRSGWVGIQRYAWTWTGDTASEWEMLPTTIATVLGMNLSGAPFTGPDVGGFSGAPDAELYIRWLQLAALLPFFRGHAALTSPPREPWVFGEPWTSIARETLRLRQRLLPYLYTLAWEAHTRGQPIVRPLWWHHPRAADLWSAGDAFLLGDALLVAPALASGQQERFVHLPWGGWYDFYDPAEPRFGPAEVLLPTPIQRAPLLVRAGALLPLEDSDTLTLWLGFPPEGETRAMIYLDAGDGNGPHRLETWKIVREGSTLALQRTAEGDFPFPYRRIRLAVHGAAIERLEADGWHVPPEDDGAFLLPPDTTAIVATR